MLPHIYKALTSLRNDVISVESSQLLALCCLAVKLTDSARWFLNQVLLREPGHVGALFQMGQLYYNSGKPGLAREYARKVLQQEPNHPEATALIKAVDAQCAATSTTIQTKSAVLTPEENDHG
jgi:tetratricopeptide (TPR) repeat protein